MLLNDNSLAQFYTSIYQAMVVEKTRPQQFVIYQATDETGWGNKLRGLYSAFLLALVTQRLFLTDYTLFLEVFNPPPGIEWDMHRFRDELRSPLTLYELDPCHRPQEMDWLATADLTTSFTQTVILHTQGNAFDQAILSNPFCQPILQKLFSQDVSRFALTGQIMAFLLRHPRSQFLALVDQTRIRLKWNKCSPTVGVQFRTFYDVGSPQRQYCDRFLHNLHTVLQQSTGLDSAQFFVTTDDTEVTTRVAQSLSSLGLVLVDPHPVVHTGSDCTTFSLKLRCWLDRWGNRAIYLGRRWLHRNSPPELLRTRVDWYSFLPRSHRQRPQYLALVSWYLLGDCDLLISTMTSYAVLAAARTGNRSTLIKIDVNSNRYDLIDPQTYTF